MKNSGFSDLHYSHSFVVGNSSDMRCFKEIKWKWLRCQWNDMHHRRLLHKPSDLENLNQICWIIQIRTKREMKLEREKNLWRCNSETPKRILLNVEGALKQFVFMLKGLSLTMCMRNAIHEILLIKIHRYLNERTHRKCNRTFSIFNSYLPYSIFAFQ